MTTFYLFLTCFGFVTISYECISNKIPTMFEGRNAYWLGGSSAKEANKICLSDFGSLVSL